MGTFVLNLFNSLFLGVLDPPRGGRYGTYPCCEVRDFPSGEGGITDPPVPPFLTLRSPSRNTGTVNSSVRHARHQGLGIFEIRALDALDGLLQPVLLDSASSTCCCTFLPTFASPWRNSFVQIHGGTAVIKAKCATTPQKLPKNHQNLGVGSSYGTNKPPSEQPSFPYEHVADVAITGDDSESLHVYCNTLQHTATHRITLQHTATHCNTLQHTATHSSALQHATHRTAAEDATCIIFPREGRLWNFGGTRKNTRLVPF